MPPPYIKSENNTPKEEAQPAVIQRGMSLMLDLEVSDDEMDTLVPDSKNTSPRERKKSPVKVHRQSSKSESSSKSRDRSKRDRSQSQEKRDKHHKSKKSK